MIFGIVVSPIVGRVQTIVPPSSFPFRIYITLVSATLNRLPSLFRFNYHLEKSY